MADTLPLVRHDTDGLLIVTDRVVSRATVLIGGDGLSLAISRTGSGFVDLPMTPEDARHLAGALMLGAAEAESEAAALAEHAA